jgi:hypothetical protein
MSASDNKELFSFIDGHAGWAEHESDEKFMAAIYEAVDAYCDLKNDDAGHLVCYITLDEILIDYFKYKGMVDA